MAIPVRLQDHTGNVQHKVKLSETAPAIKLAREIVSTLQFPITDAEWRPIIYNLSNEDGPFKDDDTLQSRNVQPDDMLTLLPVIPASQESGNARIDDDQPRSEDDDQPHSGKKIAEQFGGTFVSPMLTSDYPGSLPVRIPLASTVPVAQLISDITAQRRLPVVNAEGHAIQYRLRHNRHLLRLEETLADRGITKHDMLVLEYIPPTIFGDPEDQGEGWSQQPEGLFSQKLLISYHYADFAWAEWVTTQIQENESKKYSLVMFDCENKDDGDDDYFETKMHRSMKVAREADRIIVILSRKYLRSSFAQAQLNIAARKDPDGRKKLLLPVRIESWNDELVGE